MTKEAAVKAKEIFDKELEEAHNAIIERWKALHKKIRMKSAKNLIRGFEYRWKKGNPNNE